MITAMPKTKKILLAVGACALTGCASSVSIETVDKKQFVDVDYSISQISNIKYKLKSTPLYEGIETSKFNSNYDFNRLNLGSHRLNRYKDGNYSYNVDGNDALGYHDKSTNVYYITNSNGKGFFYDGDNTVYNKLQSYADLVINKDYTFCYEVYNKLKSYVEDKDSWSYDVLEVMMSDIGDTVGYNSFAKKELDGKSYEEQIFITMDKVKDKYYFTDVIIRDKLEVDGEPKYSAIEMHIDIVHENEELDNIVFSKPNAEVAKGNVDLDDIDFGLIDSLK